MAFTTKQAGMQQQQLTDIPAAYQGDAQDLARAQRLAEMLTSSKAPEGQMISGRFVAPSWTQQLNQLVNAGLGAYYSDKAETEQQALAKKIREGETAALADFMDTKQGKAAIPDQVTEMAGPYGKGVGQGGVDIPQPTATLAGRPAIAPNEKAAYSNLYSDPRATARLQDMGFKGMIAPPEEITLSEGQKRFVKNPDGTVREVASGGEKLYPVKGNLVTASGKVIYSAGGGDGEGSGVGGSNVNNNGVRVGSYDKTGRYRAPTGQVYTAKAVDEARAEHDAATDLAYKLNQLDKKDVKNAYGSLTDYTTSKIGRMAGSTTTVDAQTKINNIGINNTLNNLSRLKGASSDKEMAQMIKDFPGFEADPVVMDRWVERAAKATNRFLKRSEGRFGFDTEYAEEGRFGQSPKEQKGEIATPGAPKVGEVRQGYRFKGGDQYDQNNWVKI
jgi:flagellar hook-associated protein FlgK